MCDKTSMVKQVSLAILLLAGMEITPALADSCLSAEDTRAVVMQKNLVPLQDIVRTARSSSDAELISARLCETNGNMVYMIAMLGKNGRVMRMTVDARSGEIINHR
jgi:uncharacterized membrane protein YkoI